MSSPFSYYSPFARITKDEQNARTAMMLNIMKRYKDKVDALPTSPDFGLRKYKGMSPFGSFWDHVTGYYEASLERPSKVLFFKYEDLKNDPENTVKDLAKFMGKPFTEEEESEGLVQKVIELCEFKSLRKETKDEKPMSDVLTDDLFFRKGVVGDSVNYLTTEMMDILDKITQEKCHGLNF